LLIVMFGCHPEPPPVAPGEPIPPASEVVVEAMDTECDGMIAAYKTYGDCPNHTDEIHAWVKRIVELEEDTFAAGKKGKPDEKAQHVIALACHKAAVSVKNATLRCLAGKPPPPNY
jgi:hypothetical protein